MERTIPSDPNEFNDLLLRIDRQLANENVSIDLRLGLALGLVSSEFGIPLPLDPSPSNSSHPAARNWPISERIWAWYRKRYGDRLKSDLGPGRMAFLIENDVWVFRFPLSYGESEFIASRTAESVPMRTDGQPAVYDILDSIEKLPGGLRHSLNDHELLGLLNLFELGIEGLQRIQSLGGDELIRSALADIDACINHLSNDQPNFGLSKWSSLQAGEKILKATIHQRGALYPKNHKLRELAQRASDTGLRMQIDPIIDLLQCTPGIRYGEERCTLLQAVEAHHAVFKLAFEVTDAHRSSPVHHKP